MNVIRRRTSLLLVSSLLLCPAAQAGVVVNGTRVIYPAQAREVTVQVNNVGDTPSLVQAWIDAGDVDQTPEDSDAPFVLTPPISRVEPGSSQALRVIYSGRALPADRETVFWLNVLDVPPVPEEAGGAGQNYLQVAFRSRLKLFFRPQGLKGHANDAVQSLQWTLGGDRLRVHNPTPYHVTLAEAHARAAGQDTVIQAQGRMIAPDQQLEFIVPAATEEVRFRTINDYGGRIERSVRLDAGR